ncbi:ionotropic receptor 25a-like [Littorina saxatilis]
MQDEENTLYQVSQTNFDNLTLDGQIVMENNTVRKLGTWTHGSGWQTDESIKDRLDDPSIIRVATIESPPFVFRTDDENGTHYSGYAIDVLDEITKRMNISYRFIEPSDGMFGARLPNGTWNGVIGDILSGSVDIAVGSLTVSAEREEVVDFTTPFYEFVGIEILVKEVPKEQNLLFFVTVFSEPMWGAWFGVLLLTGFLLAVFDYLSPFSVRNTRGKSGGGDGGDGGGGYKKDREEEAGKDTFDLKEGLWLVTASFTLSGPESTPRTPSSRMLVAGFWFFCTIIMANYTANLAAFLTTSRLTTPINSLADLAIQSKIRFSVVDGTTTMSYFERMARIESNFYELWKNISSNMVSAGTLAKSEVAVWDYPLGDTYVKVWSDIEKTGLLASTQEGLDKVMAGDFALIDEAPSLQYAISQYCGLTTIGKQFSTKSYAFALPQGSPLTEQVSNYILKLQSETILEKLKQLWWKDSAEGCVEVEESEGLSFTTLGGVFLLAGVGVAAGLLLCFLEIGWAWLSSKRRKKSDVIPPITSRTDLVQEFDLDSKYDTITNVDDVTAEIQMSAF